LIAICRDDGFPNKSTVFRRLVEDATFREMYARAKTWTRRFSASLLPRTVPPLPRND
jgi:hypothetical protein